MLSQNYFVRRGMRGSLAPISCRIFENKKMFLGASTLYFVVCDHYFENFLSNEHSIMSFLEKRPVFHPD